MFTARPYTLTLAGFDPSAGAGVLADIKTFEHLGVYGLAVLTANTIQTEKDMHSVRWMPLPDILEGLSCMLLSYPVGAVKIGILPSMDYLAPIVEHIRRHRPQASIIWDPIQVSSSGYTFFQSLDHPKLRATLNALTLLTPNIDEYNWLTEKGLFKLLNTKRVSVLRKGGHDDSNPGIDVLTINAINYTLGLHENIVGTEKHGSGCVLSAAIAAFLSQGHPLLNACRLGKKYVSYFLNSNNTLLGYHDFS